MDRSIFAERFHVAVAAARDFARTFVEEALPDPMRFRVELNSSYDGNPLHRDEVVFPNDGLFERAAELKCCTADQAIDVLWRDGRVPEWIDVSVVGELGSATLLQLLCCGRFTGNDELLYHEHEGRPPFHVLGPTLPARLANVETHERFSIYDRSQCWTRRDIEHLAPHAHKVWSLELVGGEFDDDALLALPPLPALELLELRRSPIAGRGLVALARLPRLRTVRLGFVEASAFLASHLGSLTGVEWLEVTDPPTRPWGARSVLASFPRLNRLTFASRAELFVEGSCPELRPGPLAGVSLTAERLTGDFALPPTLPSLYAHLRGANDADVERLLERVRSIESLDLSGTPVSAALVERLLARHKLRYLNVVGTRVDADAVLRIRVAHPALKLLPKVRTDGRK